MRRALGLIFALIATAAHADGLIPQNSVVAGPTGGGQGFPRARSLVAADVPNLDASKITTGTLAAARLPSAPLAASLGADVLLNNTANYFDGPSVAQGTTGTWFASGTVTVNDSVTAQVYCKLWDGATVIASADVTVTASYNMPLTLSGFLTSPAANIRISCRDQTNTSGKIIFNVTGNSKDSTLTAFRIN